MSKSMVSDITYSAMVSHDDIYVSAKKKICAKLKTLCTNLSASPRCRASDGHLPELSCAHLSSGPYAGQGMRPQHIYRIPPARCTEDDPWSPPVRTCHPWRWSYAVQRPAATDSPDVSKSHWRSECAAPMSGGKCVVQESSTEGRP